MTNDQVVNAWVQGKDEASSGNGNLSVRGGSLFSYNLMIGERSANRFVVYDYTAASGAFRSQTTSCHVGLAKYGLRHVAEWDVVAP